MEESYVPVEAREKFVLAAMGGREPISMKRWKCVHSLNGKRLRTVTRDVEVRCDVWGAAFISAVKPWPEFKSSGGYIQTVIFDPDGDPFWVYGAHKQAFETVTVSVPQQILKLS